jgi:hypothetical protein
MLKLLRNYRNKLPKHTVQQPWRRASSTITQRNPQMTVFVFLRMFFFRIFYLLHLLLFKDDWLSIRKLSGKVFIVFWRKYPLTQTILLKQRKGNGIIFQYQMLVIIIQRKSLYSQNDSSLAVQALLDPGDITGIYRNSTFLWYSFNFTLFKESLPFQAGISRKGFRHGNDVRCHFSSKCPLIWTYFRLVL